jgi:DNA polymerase III subunit alpha
MMRVAQKFAGYSLAEADNLRKACGKKIRELMAKEREKFIEGAVKTGYSAELGKRWFDLIEPFADYSFNKSHAYGYGFISYQTAYLKANWPVQYMACLLSHVNDLERAAVYLNECRLMGIDVLVPDINSSVATFVAADGKIPFGLTTIKGVGHGPVELIVKEREENGPFRSFADFCNRVSTDALKKNTCEALIKAGAFESLGYSRKGLLQMFEQILGEATKRRKKEAVGQFDLFSTVAEEDEAPVEPEIPAEEWNKSEKLAIERELLGLYVSDHPLRGVENMLSNRTNCTLDEVSTRTQNEQVVIGGLISNVEKKFTKKNHLMAIITIEDLFSSIEVVIFPKTLPKFDRMLVEGNIVVAQGRIDIQGEKHKFLLENMTEIRIAIDDAVPLHLDLNEDEVELVNDLKTAFGKYPGNSEVFIHVGDKVYKLPKENNVELCPQLTSRINTILGRG